MDWYRRYTERGQHPQLFRVGFWGMVGFDALCDLSAKFDLGGIVPGEYVEPDYLDRWLFLDRETDETRAAFHGSGWLTKLFDAGLCRMENKHVIIDGWERRQTLSTDKSTERVRKFREKQRAEARETFLKRDETDETLEEKRREETRGEETTPSAPPSGDPLSAQSALTLDLAAHGLDGPPGKPKKKAKAEPNPRLVPLRDRLVATFEAIRRQKYAFDGAKDANAVKRLAAMALDDNEIDRRWRNALADSRWGAAGLAQFAATVNKWGGATVHQFDVTRGAVRAESQVYDGPGGELAKGEF